MTRELLQRIAKCAVFLPLGDDRDFSGYGPTRAIAVGEAFCKVFEGLR